MNESFSSGQENTEQKELLERFWGELQRAGVIHQDNAEAKEFFKRALAGEFKGSFEKFEDNELMHQFDTADSDTQAKIEKELQGRGIDRIQINNGERYNDYRLGEHYIVVTTNIGKGMGGTFGKIRSAGWARRNGEVVKAAEVDINA